MFIEFISLLANHNGISSGTINMNYCHWLMSPSLFCSFVSSQKSSGEFCWQNSFRHPLDFVKNTLSSRLVSRSQFFLVPLKMCFFFFLFFPPKISIFLQFFPLLLLMTLQLGPPANRHLGARLCGVMNQWGWAKVQPGHRGQTDSLLLLNWDLCVLMQEWACACGCLPYLRWPSDECVWLCPCVVKQMESVSSGTVSPCELLNELVPGSQSWPPATSEVTPWRRV